MTVLWTVLPLEMVFDGWEKCPVYEEIDFAGARVEVERLSPLESRVVRLLSTDPADFLRPELQPGVLVSYKPAVPGQ